MSRTLYLVRGAAWPPVLQAGWGMADGRERRHLTSGDGAGQAAGGKTTDEAGMQGKPAKAGQGTWPEGQSCITPWTDTRRHSFCVLGQNKPAQPRLRQVH